MFKNWSKSSCIIFGFALSCALDTAISAYKYITYSDKTQKEIDDLHNELKKKHIELNEKIKKNEEYKEKNKENDKVIKRCIVDFLSNSENENKIKQEICTYIKRCDIVKMLDNENIKTDIIKDLTSGDYATFNEMVTEIRGKIKH